MVACLIVCLQKAGHKAINFDQLQKITQGLEENSKANRSARKYTKLDPTLVEGTIVLNTHFISQSSPDILKKLKKVEKGPEIPRDLLNLAFKIFNDQEEQAKLEKAQ